MSQAAPGPDLEFQALVRTRYAGNPQAITDLGARLLVGRDAPYAPLDGTALIAEAAQQGDAGAWHYVAVLAASGIGRGQSWSDAYAALTRAAELGHAHARRQIDVLAGVGMSGGNEVRSSLTPPAAHVLRDAPHFVTYMGFLPAAFCAYLIDRAQPKLVPAQVNDARGGGLKLDPMRTNTTAVFTMDETDFIVQLVRARIAAAAGVPFDALEPAEVLHYSVGETYKPHVDFFHPSVPNFAEEMRQKGQRIKTCLVYLNDEFDGGETEFSRIGVKFRGRTGEALVFDNVLPNGTGDMNTVHTGRPPTRGEKWLLSQWIRSKAQRVA
jgi:prolyl 4-hydroxylase